MGCRMDMEYYMVETIMLIYEGRFNDGIPVKCM